MAVAKAALRCLLLLAPPLTAGAGGGNPRASLPAAADDDAAAMLTKGWDRAFWPGRFEAFSIPVGESVCTTVVLDVAHNVDSVARLLEEARGRCSSPSSSELWALFGTGSDKDAAGMLAELLAPAQGEAAAAGGAMIRRLALCQARHPRAVPVDALAALAARAKSGSPTTPRGPNGLLARASPTTTTIVRGEAAAGTTPEAALERLLAEAAAGGGRGGVVLLVCGSFYVVAAARAHLAATRPGLFASRKGEDWAFHPDPPLKGGVM